MKIKVSCFVMLFITPICLALSSEAKSETTDLTHLISDYRISLASLPLDYALLEKRQLDGVVLQRYKLTSQSWSPQGVVSPERWQHAVDIYIPDSARQENALLVINNGTNDSGSGKPIAPTNFTEKKLSRIAVDTSTIVISVSNVPNQKLKYHGVAKPLAEDDSVAYSWKLFMKGTEEYQNASLHIPMSASVSQTLQMAKKELAKQNINKFIVTGASKRGWAAWLAAVSDPDVKAIVPFAMDLLDTQRSLEHMYRSYGGNWPIAFYPYYKQEIDKQIGTNEFSLLMTLEDPLAYLNTNIQDRLKIEKYIINASGDDFYTPDNSHFYYNKLPGVKSLRVVPNSTHNGILSVSEQSLITFVNRYQNHYKLPEITEKVQGYGSGGKALTVSFSEKPTSILSWTARNPVARDFRYACGIQYRSEPIDLPSDDRITIPLTKPDNGWQATYVEATFSDGYVATTQVYITPNEYPETAPPSSGSVACQTLPGRGLASLEAKP